jgi:hypothetical protein
MIDNKRRDWTLIQSFDVRGCWSEEILKPVAVQRGSDRQVQYVGKARAYSRYAVGRVKSGDEANNLLGRRQREPRHMSGGKGGYGFQEEKGKARMKT